MRALLFLFGLLGVSLPGEGVQEKASIEVFDEAILSHLREHRLPGGALAVVREGRLVYARGFGWADMEAKEAPQPTSLFRIASLSKPITAAAVLTLVRKGRLDLDAKAFSLLDLEPHLVAGGKADPRLGDVTIRQLLEHRGGWDREKSGDPMFRSVEIARDLGLSPPAPASAIIRWMMGRPLDFAPGTRFAYSNFGYCVLGRVIEKSSGESYEGYVQKAVLGPMGISRMRLGKSKLEDRAPGEVRYYEPVLGPAASVFGDNPESRVPLPYGGFCLEAMDAHGGWISSAVDLARFASSLDKVLGPAELDALWAPPAGLKSGPAYYACGWMVRRASPPGRATTWHTGSLPGTTTLLVRRHDGLSWVALFNARSEGALSIDPELHRAADRVREWPEVDLFARFP